MFVFSMKKKVFISHRRNFGQASTEAILIKEMLSKDSGCKIFIDVTEDYLGAFPHTLKSKIAESDAFLLLIPNAHDYSYLCDKDNWVHREIFYALTFKDAKNKPSRIVPVTFDRNFKFPSKEELGDIAEIADYNFIYYDTNSTESANKIKRALGISKNNIVPYLITSIILIAAFVFGLSMIKPKTADANNYIYPESNQFEKNLNRFNTFNQFTDSSGAYVNQYLTWYLSELDNGSDTRMNTEFNEVYIKNYCIRLIVLAYLAFSNSDLDKPFDDAEINKYVNKCFDNIPQEHRYPISLKSKSNEERTKDMETILDVTINTLNTDPTLKSIDDAMLPALKLRLISKIWPYS